MARKGIGYLTLDDPSAARRVEVDTACCSHCQRIIPLHSLDGTRRTSIAMCSMCGPAPVCDACDRDGRCTPFLRRIEEHEQRARLLAAVGA